MSETEETDRKEQQLRIDHIVRALAVKDAPHEGARHDDRARIARVKETCLLREPERARIERDEGEHASVGEERNARDGGGCKGFSFDECFDRELPHLPLRQDDFIRQTE